MLGHGKLLTVSRRKMKANLTAEAGIFTHNDKFPSLGMPLF
jgi:hypothetical protein